MKNPHGTAQRRGFLSQTRAHVVPSRVLWPQRAGAGVCATSKHAHHLGRGAGCAYSASDAPLINSVPSRASLKSCYAARSKRDALVARIARQQELPLFCLNNCGIRKLAKALHRAFDRELPVAIKRQHTKFSKSPHTGREEELPVGV